MSSSDRDRWSRERQYSRDCEGELRPSREPSPEREPPRNKAKRTYLAANPNVEVYQCHYGHLMCIGCFYRLLADARIKDEQARCPKCRVDMSRNSCVRSLIVERLLSELLQDCPYCNLTMSRTNIDHHMRDCKSRPVSCLYSKVGCNWNGAAHMLSQHVEECAAQHRTCREVISTISKNEKKYEDEINKYRVVTNFMSHHKLFFTDDFIPQLFYESTKFNLFGHYWLVRGKVQGDEHNFERTLSLKLILKGKSNVDVEFCFLKDSFSNVDIAPEVHRHSFTSEDCESDYKDLRLVRPLDINNLLAEKSIKFRLYVAQM